MAHLLLVASDTPVRRALRAMLVSTGYDVACADDGAAAMTHLRHHRIDLLVTDLRLPLMDGLALVLAAKKQRPQIKALIMSNEFSLQSNLRALDVRVESVMQKPFSVQDLRGEVARLLPGRLRVA